jgi:homopolymeric O-antigen transport system permease protein
MVNFLLSVPLLVLAGWLYGVAFVPLAWLCLVPVVVLQCFFTIGLVLSLAALNVHYRDVQHIVANLLLLWFFLTPIVYPASQVPERMQLLLWLNPLALFVEVYHAVFVAASWPRLDALAMLAVYTLVSLLTGAKIFDGYRDTFAELI